MHYNSDFKYDLKVGQAGERKLGNILKNKYIEVKTDTKAHITGNVFIEYSSRGRMSGICSTRAEYYCFVLSDDLLILIKVEKLKKLCEKYFKTDRNIRGGDSNTSKGILLPVKDMIDNM